MSVQKVFEKYELISYFDSCCVSPCTRLDMSWVSTLWRRDLEEYLHSKLASKRLEPTLPMVTASHGWQVNRAIMTYASKSREGTHIEGKSHRCLGAKYRPRKCWSCTERHVDGDPVCPMARRDPERWEIMTKKVRGRRVSVDTRPTIRGTRIVFDE